MTGTEALPETEDDLGGPESFTTLYERIYAKLDRLIGEWPPTGEVLRLTAPGLMDLLVEVLRRSGGSLRVSLAHYYEVGGDLVPDPDMELKVMPKTKMAEALSYQDAFVHREVYPEPEKVNVAVKADLNAFLDQWLSNLLDQGHQR